MANRGGGRRKQRPAPQPSNPQLFDDTSTQQHYGAPGGPGYYADSYSGPPPHYQPQTDSSVGQFGADNSAFAGQQYLNDPMANMAMQYGTSLAGQGRDYVEKNIERWIPMTKMKYYFAVDTTYVAKKLGLLVFPYAHTDWSIKYNQDEPVAPRYEVNAPDLYIPVMAFVTYVLLAGVCLGTQDRFSPEQLGIIASSALVWMIIEILLLVLSMYVLNVTTNLKYLDLLAYCGYKYLGMIFSLMGSLVFRTMGYYVALAWFSASLAFFLVRSLKVAITPHENEQYGANATSGTKRRLYTLVVIAVTQPVFMWWLTRHLSV